MPGARSKLPISWRFTERDDHLFSSRVDYLDRTPSGYTVILRCRKALAAAERSGSSRHAQRSAPWLALAAASSGVGSISFATAYADSRRAAVDRKPTQGHPLLLYQYDVCPWCNKVKSVLDYYNVPYKTVEVNPVWKSEIKFSDYKKVPIVVFPNGEQMNESTQIIEHIAVEYSGETSGWYALVL
jgi:glutaredoxin